MADFPHGGNVELTQKWLNKHNFGDFNFLSMFNADALIGLNIDHILELVDNDKVSAIRLMGMLNTATKCNSSTCFVCPSLNSSCITFIVAVSTAQNIVATSALTGNVLFSKLSSV